MAKGKQAAEDIEPAEAPAKVPAMKFSAKPGLIRLLRRPFDLGAPRMHFKQMVGINNANGRAIKKPVSPVPIPEGAGWEEWLIQDNAGNRATIETAYRDPAFCYTPIYPEDADAGAKFGEAVQAYIGQLETACEGFDARFRAIQEKTEKIQAEIEKLMNGGLTEAEEKKLYELNRQDEALRSDRFEAEKSFRICSSRIKSQRELLERLG